MAEVEASLEDDAFVVRGGRCRPQSFLGGVRSHPKVPGVAGFSVQSANGVSVAELAEAGKIPHSSIGVTTVGRVRELGLDVRPTPGRGLHATVVTGEPLEEEVAERLSAIFEVRKNPRERP